MVKISKGFHKTKRGVIKRNPQKKEMAVRQMRGGLKRGMRQCKSCLKYYPKDWDYTNYSGKRKPKYVCRKCAGV